MRLLTRATTFSMVFITGIETQSAPKRSSQHTPCTASLVSKAVTVFRRRNVVRDGIGQLVDDVGQHRWQRAHELLPDDVDVVRVPRRLRTERVSRLDELAMA